MAATRAADFRSLGNRIHGVCEMPDVLGHGIGDLGAQRTDYLRQEPRSGFGAQCYRNDASDCERRRDRGTTQEHQDGVRQRCAKGNDAADYENRRDIEQALKQDAADYSRRAVSIGISNQHDAQRVARAHGKQHIGEVAQHQDRTHLKH